MSRLDIHTIEIGDSPFTTRIRNHAGAVVEGILEVRLLLLPNEAARVSVVFEVVNLKIHGFEKIQYDSTTEAPKTVIKERPLDYSELQEQAAKQGYMLVPNDHDETESVILDAD